MRTAAADTFQVSSPLSTDIYDRELVFIETVVRPLIPDMPRTLKIVLEHIDHVSSFIIQSERHVGSRRYTSAFILFADIETRIPSFGAIEGGDVRFVEILRRDRFRAACHMNKESMCGCAGVYTAHVAVELYAEALERECIG